MPKLMNFNCQIKMNEFQVMQEYLLKMETMDLELHPDNPEAAKCIHKLLGQIFAAIKYGDSRRIM